MKNYNIVYIDEQEYDANNFKDYLDSTTYKDQFVVNHIYPAQSLKEMTELINQASPDALVCDYRLNDHISEIGYPVPYDGFDLVSSYLRIRHKFPCFLMTSYALEAAQVSDDVNIVYVKGILHDDVNQANDASDIEFIARVKLQIEHYKNQLLKAEDRLIELLESGRKKSLNMEEEKELIELDTLLEASIDNRVNSRVPEELKYLSNSERLTSLLDKADKLIETLNNNE